MICRLNYKLIRKILVLSDMGRTAVLSSIYLAIEMVGISALGGTSTLILLKKILVDSLN